MAKDAAEKLISENRKARFNYHIQETLEAGVVLSGREVKSLRAGHGSLQESYAKILRGELWLVGMHIPPYAFDASASTYNPTRSRKLLVHAKELKDLTAQTEREGMTLVPLKLYLKGGFVKCLIGVAKGKDAPDKRKTIKAREDNRKMKRVIKQAQR